MILDVIEAKVKNIEEEKQASTNDDNNPAKIYVNFTGLLSHYNYLLFLRINVYIII